MDAKSVRQIEDDYLRLRGQRAAGRLTTRQFDEALKQLMFQDEQGRYWSIGADGSKWYVYDGAKWVEANPESSTATGAVPPQRPNSLPESASSQRPVGAPNLMPPPPAPRPVAPTSRPAPSSPGTSRALLAAAAAVVILVLVLLAAAAGGLFTQKEIVEVVPFATSTIVAGQALATPSLTLTSAPEQSTPQPGLAVSPTALVSSNVPGVNASVLGAATPTPIAAKDFAALNSLLAQKIAALNQAELKFIRDMRASASNGRFDGLALPSQDKGTLTDQDIKDVAGKAMDVAILADQLGEVTSKQDKGSAQAGKSADAFYAIARNAFSLALDAQNVRTALESGLIPGGQAIEVIGEYGAQMWNNAVTDGGGQGNPFTSQSTNSEPVQSLNPAAVKQVQASGNSNNGAIWIAESGAQTTKTIDVPAPKSPVSNPFDPQLMSSLTTADGQTDGNQAQQVAAANLQALGAKANGSDPTKATQLQVPSAPVAVAGSDQLKAGNIPTYKGGQAIVISRNGAGDANPFMQTFGLDGDQPPTDGGKTPIQDAPALVALNLDNIVVENVNKRAPGSGSFEADLNFSFTVSWSTKLAAPQFKLNCNSHTEQLVTQSSGSITQHANGLLIIFPGTVTVYCYANSLNGQALGSTSVNVLVGDPDQATVRAQQVETDSAQLNATLTAEALGTSDAQQTGTAVANAQASQTAQAQTTIDAVSTEVAGTTTAEFKLTASAFETQRAQPPPVPPTPTETPTFTPKVVDNVFHAGDVMAVTTNVVLQRGRLYRFTFSGRVNLINPTKSVTAHQLPEHVNGVTVGAGGIVVIEGTGSVATISCGSGESDPKDPGGYSIVVEDLGPS